MPIIGDGDGPYALRPDGTKEYGTMTEFSIDDEDIVKFAPEAGVLSLSADEESCRLLREAHGITGDGESRDVRLPGGFLPGVPPVLVFKGVRSIISLPPRKRDGRWFFELRKSEGPDS